MLAVTHISLTGWTASAYWTYPEAKSLDLVIGILMLATALLFVGIALHAGRDKKPPHRSTD